MKHTKSYVKDYPRPQLVRDNWLNLNGSWDFAFDQENKGEALGWQKKFPNARQITVPFSYQTALSGIESLEPCENVWYNKMVVFSKEQLENKRVILNFEGCDYICKLWVNGIFVGFQQGGYHRMSFDITTFVENGENQITVKAEDTYSCTQPRGKQKWEDKNFGCWYTESTGIWKTVWCELVPQQYIKSIKITPSNNTYNVHFDFCVNEFVKGLEVSAIICFADKKVCEISICPERKDFSLIVDLTSEVHDFKVHTWSAQSPNLYDVEFRLKVNKNDVDVVKSYFGVRSIEIQKNSILINNTPLYLKMLLDQGFWPSSHFTAPDEAAIAEDVSLTLEMGFNGIRKHQKIEDERFYYYCDILGIYVWTEMPSHYEYNDTAVSQVSQEWAEVVKQHYNHPSVIVWVPFNESWGIQRVAYDKKQQKFTQAIYYLTKSIDNTRPVITNDGWEHTISDIITLHNYAETGDMLTEAYDNIADVLDGGFTMPMLPRQVMANGYKYQGQPILMSEFAGIAFVKDRDAGWGYGNMVKDEISFIARLKGQVEAIRKMKWCCGYCITQTTDAQQEVNGILTADRKLKIPMEEIKKITSI